SASSLYSIITIKNKNRMNHLIIIAHPREDSLNYDIKNKIQKYANTAGDKVKVRDLYKMKFNPVLDYHELKYLKEGHVCPDILVEQSYISWADELTFIYPLWWNAFPALLKGYIDRVFTHGFAFKVTESGVKGLLKGKRVRLITSAGMDKQFLTKMNILESLKITQDKGVFEFCGMEVIDHAYITESTQLSYKQKEDAINNILKKVGPHRKQKTYPMSNGSSY
ncbi:MAG TPA: NAD(P)H-dependent oxidoreductase, partial [Bacteroidales bacterium]|nr:NAD(P)H-dependent oxidoreductase [Bacteroidales bacterium]